MKDGITLLEAFKINNLYIIRSKKTLKEQCKISAKLSNVELWHKRFYHLNVNQLKKLASDKMVKGLPVFQQSLFDCTTCIKGK